MTETALGGGVPWQQGLTDEQRTAASAHGRAHRLLAGPGTGKTLVMARHILYLVQQTAVPAEGILAITFTRAATFELRKRARAGLGEGGGLPRVSTLHSFALRQLLRNEQMMRELGTPLRIADDWEQRHIIEEDIKRLTDRTLRDTQRAFLELSADWETLNAERDDWRAQFPDPRFLAAWLEHREIFGYALRSELVYRLKRVIQEFGDRFTLERAAYLLVDEYQDLNPCDLSIVAWLVVNGAEPYVAGDDDQSIYGFRNAFPLAIRRFPAEYDPCTDLPLTVCKRCDPLILGLGLFVAGQDYDWEEKPIMAESGRGPGEVRILSFDNQYVEAEGVARICRYLVDIVGYSPHDILILLRSDRHRAFSRVLREALEAGGVPAATVTGETPLDSALGRRLLAILRLCQNEHDHLAIRTILQLSHGIAQTTLARLYADCKASQRSFSPVVRGVAEAPDVLGPLGKRVASAANSAWCLAAEIRPTLAELQEKQSSHELLHDLLALARQLATEGEALDDLSAYLQDIVLLSEAGTLPDFFHALQAVGDDAEQHIQAGSVNILTMHGAKGLTAKAVIVVGCDDRLIPGRNTSEPDIGDERRLLYVSLTRAEHHLFVTSCHDRVGQQRRSGRTGEWGTRRLTRFLRDGPVAPEPGLPYVDQLELGSPPEVVAAAGSRL